MVMKLLMMMINLFLDKQVNLSLSPSSHSSSVFPKILRRDVSLQSNVMILKVVTKILRRDVSLQSNVMILKVVSNILCGDVS